MEVIASASNAAYQGVFVLGNGDSYRDEPGGFWLKKATDEQIDLVKQKRKDEQREQARKEKE